MTWMECCLFVFGKEVIRIAIEHHFADTLNGLMALPNLIALALLSGVVVKCTKEYFAKGKSLEEPK